MGKEAIATISWQGTTAEAKALLETHEIIVRGDIRARIPRTAITLARVEDDDLVVESHDGPLTIGLGAATAAKWAEKLNSPLPSLAAKLGVGPDRPAFVIGSTDDAQLMAALDGATTDRLDAAAILVAVLNHGDDVAAAHRIAAGMPALHLWCVHPKGKGASVTDSDIRTYMRANGYIDSKTSGVSDRLTATRYAMRK